MLDPTILKNDIESLASKDGSLDVLAQHILGVACSEGFNQDVLFKIITNIVANKKMNLITGYYLN